MIPRFPSMERSFRRSSTRTNFHAVKLKATWTPPTIPFLAPATLKLKLHPKHELNLPGQTRARVRRGGVVVVVVEIVGGGDLTEVSDR